VAARVPDGDGAAEAAGSAVGEADGSAEVSALGVGVGAWVSAALGLSGSSCLLIEQPARAPLQTTALAAMLTTAARIRVRDMASA
jgi:hypothetical protein